MATRPARSRACALLGLLLAAASAVWGEPSERGALLYSTHCIECHNTQMHWRAQRLAHDWNSLREQVARWQLASQLQWTDEDIDAVARHLNDSIYHFPRSQAMGDALHAR